MFVIFLSRVKWETASAVSIVGGRDEIPIGYAPGRCGHRASSDLRASLHSTENPRLASRVMSRRTGDEEIALLAGQGSYRGNIGIDQRAEHLREHRFGRALLARGHQEAGRNAASSHAVIRTRSSRPPD